ncbi:MAG: thiol peroxidase [Spirochaetes bacterium]|jgi:thiol peroxidase|nr:thiol peroxidase [Spirochaetota bacterium]
MAQVTFKGTPVHTVGELPSKGSTAPDFTLTKADMADVSLRDFADKKKILNIVPSLDTGTCATSARRFNEEIKKHGDAVVLTVSGDTPFAQKRFCEASNIDSVVTLSQLRNRDFGENYDVTMNDGPLAGLLARAVVVLDTDNKVQYTQLVPEIANEPDYESALAAVDKL